MRKSVNGISFVLEVETSDRTLGKRSVYTYTEI